MTKRPGGGKLLFALALCAAACIIGAFEASSENVKNASEASSIACVEDLILLDNLLSVEPISAEDGAIDANVYTWRIEYLSGGYKVVGYIAAPKDYLQAKKPYPVLIYCRGGNANTGMLEPPYASGLARNGVIIFASQYRETILGSGKDEFGGADIEDVLSLIDFARRCAFLDGGHIALFGESRGSIMVYEVLRIDGSICAAAVTGSVPDLKAAYEIRDQSMEKMLRYRVGGTPEEVPLEYEKRSAIYWAEEINTPMLIFHTQDDNRAPIEPVDTFVKKLKSLGKDVTYVRFETGGHCYCEKEVLWEFILRHVE